MRLLHWVQSWFGKPTTSKLFVVIGRPIELYSEPTYATDPRAYGLPFFNRDLNDREFNESYRDTVRAFLNEEDAIDFAYHCNLDSVQLPVYIKSPQGWIHSEQETKKLIDSVNW